MVSGIGYQCGVSGFRAWSASPTAHPLPPPLCPCLTPAKRATRRDYEQVSRINDREFDKAAGYILLLVSLKSVVGVIGTVFQIRMNTANGPFATGFPLRPELEQAALAASLRSQLSHPPINGPKPKTS